MKKNRKIAALLLFTLFENVSVTTAIDNDLGYEFIFIKQLEAFAKKGNVFIVISTSKNSLNIIKAFDVAKKISCI